MTFAIILPAQWKRAKFFFKTVPEAKEFNKSEDETCFIKSKEGGIFIVYKDFFIKFNTDFIDLYVSEKNENYVKIAKNNPEAKTAFVQTMKKYSIILEEGVIDDVEVFKLHFPIDSKPILQLEEIKKKNEINYNKVLNKKLLAEVLFFKKFSETERENIHRGLIALYTPVDLLKAIKKLLKEHVEVRKKESFFLNLTDVLVKLILVHKNDEKKPFLCNISKQMTKQLGKNKKELIDFEEKLNLMVLQVDNYIKIKKKIFQNFSKMKKKAKIDINEIIKETLSKEISASCLDDWATQFSNALINKNYYNYLNLLPEDFYQSAWTKSAGHSVKQVIADFNSLAHSVTRNIVYAFSYHHQVNIIIFYAKAINKLVEAGDFNSTQAIFSGLNHAAVGRLKYLQELPEIKQCLEEIENLFSFADSKKNYRHAIESASNSGKTVIPYLGVHLNDITVTEEGNPVLRNNGTLNIDRIAFLGKIYSYLDNTVNCLYRVKALPSSVSLDKMEKMNFDEKKIYDMSLNIFPREKADVSHDETIKELLDKIYVKRSLPLYLNIFYGYKSYSPPRVYSKLTDHIEQQMVNKECSLEEAQSVQLFMSRIQTHAKKNFMFVEEGEWAKKVDKIEKTCINRINQLESSETLKNKIKL